VRSIAAVSIALDGQGLKRVAFAKQRAVVCESDGGCQGRRLRCMLSWSSTAVSSRSTSVRGLVRNESNDEQAAIKAVMRMIQMTMH
jgi:hypothetical protein